MLNVPGVVTATLTALALVHAVRVWFLSARGNLEFPPVLLLRQVSVERSGTFALPGWRCGQEGGVPAKRNDAQRPRGRSRR